MTPITSADALTLLRDLFEASTPLSADTPRDSLPGWDSMGALSLMAELDERFGISLSADDSRRMARVGDVLELLRRHGALQGG